LLRRRLKQRRRSWRRRRHERRRWWWQRRWRPRRRARRRWWWRWRCPGRRARRRPRVLKKRWRGWKRRPVVLNGPRRRRSCGPHRGRCRCWRWRGGELKDQPWPALRIAKGDRSTVVDEDCRHPHTVDIDPGNAAIDGDPLAAVVMENHEGRIRGWTDAVEADVGAAVEPDGHIASGWKGVSTRTQPDDQLGTERRRRHGRPLSRPSF
jgi:hypothetical protein